MKVGVYYDGTFFIFRPDVLGTWALNLAKFLGHSLSGVPHIWGFSDPSLDEEEFLGEVTISADYDLLRAEEEIVKMVKERRAG